MSAERTIYRDKFWQRPLQQVQDEIGHDGMTLCQSYRGMHLINGPHQVLSKYESIVPYTAIRGYI